MAAAGGQWAETGVEAGDMNFPEDEKEKKVIQVSLWLKKLYGNWPTPFYEVNERTVGILYNLMECCAARERDISLLIEDMKHQEAVREATTKEIQDVFKDLGLSPTKLPRKAFRCLFSLAKCAVILGTKDTSLTSLFSAINHMTSEQFETRQKNIEMQRKLNVTKKKLAAVLMLEKQLLADIENIEQCQAKEHVRRKNRSHTLEYIRDKSLELRIRIGNAEKELIASGLDRSLTHKALVQFSEELLPLQKKVMSLKKSLKTYSDLPLSIPLAKVMVEEAKLELKALENELSQELDLVEFELM